jgi:glycosyltransferase involved in cell wall biosynthesis
MSNLYKVKISIVVPIFNTGVYLIECINSLISQTLKEIEIILIDNNSTDSSRLIAENYALFDNRIKVLNQPIQGLGAVRNLGILSSSGEYLLFVDGDDYILNNACEVLYNHAEFNSSDIVKGKTQNLEKFSFKHKYYGKVSIIDSFLNADIIKKDYDIVVWLYLIKRKVLILNSLLFLEEHKYEDQLFTYKLHSIKNLSFLPLNFKFYYYRYNRTNSITNSVSIKHFDDLYQIIEMMIDHYKSNNLFKYKNSLTPILLSIYQLIRVNEKIKSPTLRFKIKKILNIFSFPSILLSSYSLKTLLKSIWYYFI